MCRTKFHNEFSSSTAQSLEPYGKQQEATSSGPLLLTGPPQPAPVSQLDEEPFGSLTSAQVATGLPPPLPTGTGMGTRKRKAAADPEPGGGQVAPAVGGQLALVAPPVGSSVLARLQATNANVLLQVGLEAIAIQTEYKTEERVRQEAEKRLEKEREEADKKLAKVLQVKVFISFIVFNDTRLLSVFRKRKKFSKKLKQREPSYFSKFWPATSHLPHPPHFLHLPHLPHPLLDPLMRICSCKQSKCCAPNCQGPCKLERWYCAAYARHTTLPS